MTGLECNNTVSSKMCMQTSTIIPNKTQENFKDELNATMNKLVNSVKSTSCKDILKKVACASYTPPCDGDKMKTVCMSKCDVLRDDCPEAMNIPDVYTYCAEPALGNSDSGFCELMRWPSARHWDTQGTGSVTQSCDHFIFFISPLINYNGRK